MEGLLGLMVECYILSPFMNSVQSIQSVNSIQAPSLSGPSLGFRWYLNNLTLSLLVVNLAIAK